MSALIGQTDYCGFGFAILNYHYGTAFCRDFIYLDTPGKLAHSVQGALSIYACIKGAVYVENILQANKGPKIAG